MKNIWTKIMLSAVLALGVTACAPQDDVESAGQEAATGQTTPSETDSPITDEFVFLTVLRDNTDSWDLLPDSDVVALAEAMCGAWSRGASTDDIFGAMLESGYAPYEAGFFVGAGTEAMCPEFSDAAGSMT